MLVHPSIAFPPPSVVDQDGVVPWFLRHQRSVERGGSYYKMEENRFTRLIETIKPKNN